MLRLVLRRRRPPVEELEALARSSAGERLTYAAVGATATSSWPVGYRHDRRSVELGPASAFGDAVERLRSWRPHLGAGITVGCDGPIADGTHVAMAAPLPVGFVLATCRIVYVHDRPDEFAWAYGTLPVHPEEGEERFAVIVRDGRTHFEIGAFSRPRHWLARAGGPLGRRLQVRATDAYVRAMRPDAR